MSAYTDEIRKFALQSYEDGKRDAIDSLIDAVRQIKEPIRIENADQMIAFLEASKRVLTEPKPMESRP